MFKKIIFIPSTLDTEIVVPAPKPAGHYMPKWFKDINRPKNIKVNNQSLVENSNAKMCKPFTDTFINGYIQETWTDIYVEDNDGEIKLTPAIGPEIFSVRNSEEKVFIPDEFYPVEFVWIEQWIPKLPKGYSILTTHPLNHDELPFKSLSAIIDSDVYHHEYNGRHPFFLKRGFSGIIPAGTPMFQIIPIKRDMWKSYKEKFNYIENKKRKVKIRKTFVDGYKNLFWHRKYFS